MRGIAAIAVMIGHYTMGYNFHLFDRSGLAVDLFFILSGFVICHSYSEKLTSGRISFSQFVKRRVIRLYPMFFMGLAIGAGGMVMLAQAGKMDYSISEIVISSAYNILFLPYFNYVGGGPIFPANGPSWSLFFELMVNLFCLVLFKLNNRNLLRIITIAFGMYIFDAAFFAYRSGEAGLLGGGAETRSIIGGVIRVTYGFTLGILLYRFAQDGRGMAKVKRIDAFLGDRPMVMYAILVLAFLFPTKIWGIYNLFFMALMAPFLVLVGSKTKCHSAASVNVARVLGWLSYPIYCLHVPVIIVTEMLCQRLHYSDLLMRVAAIGLTLVLSVVLTKFVEEPVRRQLSKFA